MQAAILWFLATLVGLAILLAFSHRPYDPTVEEVRDILKKYLDGTITRAVYDEFESVPIPRDAHLESVRQRITEIMADHSNLGPGGHVNELGAARVRELLAELEDRTGLTEGSS